MLIHIFSHLSTTPPPSPCKTATASTTITTIIIIIIVIVWSRIIIAICIHLSPCLSLSPQQSLLRWVPIFYKISWSWQYVVSNSVATVITPHHRCLLWFIYYINIIHIIIIVCSRRVSDSSFFVSEAYIL